MKKKKLDLPKSEKVVELSTASQNQVKGGGLLFTTFGYRCSIRVKCKRLWTKCWGGTDDYPCEHTSVLDP